MIRQQTLERSRPNRRDVDKSTFVGAVTDLIIPDDMAPAPRPQAPPRPPTSNGAVRPPTPSRSLPGAAKGTSSPLPLFIIGGLLVTVTLALVFAVAQGLASSGRLSPTSALPPATPTLAIPSAAPPATQPGLATTMLPIDSPTPEQPRASAETDTSAPPSTQPPTQPTLAPEPTAPPPPEPATLTPEPATLTPEPATETPPPSTPTITPTDQPPILGSPTVVTPIATPYP
ncbi:MAG: hypothetical protein HGA45_10190 [Chloroflexales bacterium]|nr:hypothetical protein [Chloroflexales bacterium]